MRLALGFNPVFPVKEMTRLAVKAESNGYESFWIHTRASTRGTS
jgi:alkanesulfonate monooxygenase SsuD/methylene tetrahydromethanopterin reductase-like flavin-dependent oxidoreductase (luciferase family)